MARRSTDELSPTEAALLAFLAFGEKSGYDLARAFEASVGMMWAPAKGHMYAILPRLVEQGWATSREVVQVKRPNKQIYRITRKGRSALQRWLERPPEVEPVRNMLLVKVFFGALAGKAATLEHIRRRKHEAEALESRMHALQRHGKDVREEALYPWLTRRYAILWARFVIAWANEAEEAIALGKPLSRPPRRFPVTGELAASKAIEDDRAQHDSRRAGGADSDPAST